MSLKEKCSNPLMSLMVFLLILVVALITAVIVLKMDNKEMIINSPQAFKAPETPESVTSFTVKPDSDSSAKIVTSRPIIFTGKPRNVCETPECITVAHQLLNWHDPNVDPCVNFYKYTCGKYIEHTVVDGNRLRKKGFIVDNLITEQLINKKPTDSKSEQALKSFYNKCDGLKDSEEEVEEEKKQAMKDVLEDIKTIGSWPLLDENWDESKFNLNDMLANIASLGVPTNGLFTMGAAGAPVLEIAPLNRANNGEPGESLKNLSLEILTENGIKFDQNTFDEDFQKYMDLDEMLSEHEVNSTAQEVTLPELQKAIPSVDFGRIIEHLASPRRKNVAGKIKETAFATRVSLFFGNNTLEDILQKTPKRTLANFLIFFYIDMSSDSISSDENDILSRDCYGIAVAKLQEAAVALFMKYHFDRENIKNVGELVEETKEHFVEMIQASTWLQETTKKNAISKIRKINKTIGYPEQFEQPGSVDKLYEDLIISPTDSYYRMVTRIDRFGVELLMDYVALESSHSPERKLLRPNASYNRRYNRLFFYVPMMDDPFFDTTLPKHAKIASTGRVLAHEVGHALDPKGMRYNGDGYKEDWWVPEDLREYEKRVQCLVKQYDNYDDPDFGQNLQGNATVLEMVADGLGAESSWRALKALDLSKEQRLVGLENEPVERVFFRIIALDYCSTRDHDDLDFVLMRVHPTHSFRVNGVVSNMKQFAETFNCPVGSPMNPVKKCELI